MISNGMNSYSNYDPIRAPLNEEERRHNMLNGGCGGAEDAKWDYICCRRIISDDK